MSLGQALASPTLIMKTAPYTGIIVHGYVHVCIIERLSHTCSGDLRTS